MREVDEDKLVRDILDGKYPFVKFIDQPSIQHETYLPNGTRTYKIFETQHIESSISDLINNNSRSQIYIFNGYGLLPKSFGPYWSYNGTLYDPYSFLPIKAGIKYLRAVIIPLSPFEINPDLGVNETNHSIQTTNKRKYKLLLIS